VSILRLDLGDSGIRTHSSLNLTTRDNSAELIPGNMKGEDGELVIVTVVAVAIVGGLRMDLGWTEQVEPQNGPTVCGVGWSTRPRLACFWSCGPDHFLKFSLLIGYCFF
jgi:hypothetical protein